MYLYDFTYNEIMELFFWHPLKIRKLEKTSLKTEKFIKKIRFIWKKIQQTALSNKIFIL